MWSFILNLFNRGIWSEENVHYGKIHLELTLKHISKSRKLPCSMYVYNCVSLYLPHTKKHDTHFASKGRTILLVITTPKVLLGGIIKVALFLLESLQI